jgi:NAD(P)-dependent dehydrogenase (short-subunit alcohol dehydrogenase family)
MDLGLHGKVALVSGGSKGIGRAIVDLLAAEGAQVVVASRGMAAVDEAVAAIRAAGGAAEGVAADMSTEAGVAQAVTAARQAFGSPDIAISNVVSADPVDALTGSLAAFTSAYESMALSVLLLARAVVPDMQAKGWGRLVNIGAGIAKEPPPQAKHAIAAMARAAVVALNKSLANELAAAGITVNTIGTGFTATESMQDLMRTIAARSGGTPEDVLKKFTASTPARRAGLPEEVAGVVAMLCSTRGGYVTGQFLPVDGGALRSAF